MHYLSVLAIFKNETDNLKVWIDHYLWQGVEHFYLIDNGSTDNPLEILQDYIDKGIVSYYYKEEKHKQAEHYRWVFDTENLKNNTYWLIVCDMDEFFYGVDHKLTTKLKTLECFNVIYANWHMFGSDNLTKQPSDIRTNIIHRKPELDKNTKYIFKTASVKNSSMIWIHGLVYPGTMEVIKTHPKIRIANKLIKLNHYPIQSLEFFQKVKMTRGSANVAKHDKIRDMDYFKRYDSGTDFKDDTLKNLIENPLPNY
jgi:glycosyltransferase involved in cell wall biosynthesis